jgi:hypothetical protein
MEIQRIASTSAMRRGSKSLIQAKKELDVLTASRLFQRKRKSSVIGSSVLSVETSGTTAVGPGEPL